MNNFYFTSQSYRKSDRVQKVKETISDVLKLAIIFLAVIIIVCIKANG